MEKEFIPYNQALALKELGFDEPCFGAFHTASNRLMMEFEVMYTPLHCVGVSAPLYQQAFRWFRDKYKLEASIQRMPPEVYGKGKGDIKNYLVYIWAELLNPRGQVTLHFDTYEEAELECLKKLIEIVKEK